MTATTAPWRELAHRLADELAAEGVANCRPKCGIICCFVIR
jgi:hypothetical protein